MSKIQLSQQQQQQMFPASSSQEDDEYHDYDEEHDEDEEMRFIREEYNQLQLPRQKHQQAVVNNGVYQVQIDAKQQKVTVSGSEDSATLIKKMIRSGKSQLGGGESLNLREVKRSTDIGAMMNLAGFNGVYQVQIDAEQQKVTVSSSVDSATLIKKLTRSGKYAVLRSQKPNQNEKKKNRNNNSVKDDKQQFKRATDIGSMMNLSGFKGNVGNATLLWGNSNGIGGFPFQSNSMIQGSSARYPSPMLMNMNGFNNHPSPSPIMMNMKMMQTRHDKQQQPQMMYHRERNPTTKPLYGFWFFFLTFALLSLNSVSALSAMELTKHPAPGPATGDPLVLAADRTKRPDILRGFQYYQGGWDIANQHYWASVGYTGGAGFVIAILWFISFGLALAIHLCYGWEISFNNQGSNHAQRICLVLLMLFTFAAATGCILICVGQGKFHGEALDTLHYVVNQSDYTMRILRNVTGYLSQAKAVNVAQLLLPSDVTNEIDKLNTDLNRVIDTLSEKTNEKAVKFRRGFKYMDIILFVVAAAMLLLAIIGLVLSILKYQHAIHVFVIIGWLVVATTFILWGVFMMLDNAISDTCMATGEWVANPDRESALTHILPCVDHRTTNRTLIQSKEVVNNIVTLVNVFIYETANANATQGPLGLGYYNQSGPFMLPLCYPFDYQFQERQCVEQEVSSANASMVWKKSVCKASASGICTTVGRVTPKIYAQLVDTLNKSYALQHYTPLLLNLRNCNFARDAFTGVTLSHCPPLKHYVRITSVGLGLISFSFMVCLVLWIVYANLPQTEEVAG